MCGLGKSVLASSSQSGIFRPFVFSHLLAKHKSCWDFRAISCTIETSQLDLLHVLDRMISHSWAPKANKWPFPWPLFGTPAENFQISSLFKTLIDLKSDSADARFFFSIQSIYIPLWTKVKLIFHVEFQIMYFWNVQFISLNGPFLETELSCKWTVE